MAGTDAPETGRSHPDKDCLRWRWWRTWPSEGVADDRAGRLGRVRLLRQAFRAGRVSGRDTDPAKPCGSDQLGRPSGRAFLPDACAFYATPDLPVGRIRSFDNLKYCPRLSSVSGVSLSLRAAMIRRSRSVSASKASVSQALALPLSVRFETISSA